MCEGTGPDHFTILGIAFVNHMFHQGIEESAAKQMVSIESVEDPPKEDLLARTSNRFDLANPPPEGPVAIFKMLRWRRAWSNSKWEGFLLKPRV